MSGPGVHLHHSCPQHCLQQTPTNKKLIDNLSFSFCKKEAVMTHIILKERSGQSVKSRIKEGCFLTKKNQIKGYSL
jgi:hypothetical protein